MKIYRGKRLGPIKELSPVSVTVDGKSLKHRIRHSPTGFEWGYSGSGPADLALSILWDYLGHEPTRADYLCFQDQFVAGWGNVWRITGDAIRAWLDTFAEAELP